MKYWILLTIILTSSIHAELPADMQGTWEGVDTSGLTHFQSVLALKADGTGIYAHKFGETKWIISLSPEDIIEHEGFIEIQLRNILEGSIGDHIGLKIILMPNYSGVKSIESSFVMYGMQERFSFPGHMTLLKTEKGSRVLILTEEVEKYLEQK